MNQNKIKKIQQLLFDEYSNKQKEEIIQEIKSDSDLKMEFALQSKILINAKEMLRQRANALNNVTPAPFYVGELSQAAFFSQKKPYIEDLPIDDETIEDFLNEED